MGVLGSAYKAAEPTARALYHGGAALLLSLHASVARLVLYV